jgi:uncharacterized YigZ family protein
LIKGVPVYSFLTIEAPAKGLFKDKGSKFLSFAFPVISEDEVKFRLNMLKKEYFDARHHCYAWVLGYDEKRWRVSDDGEPNHTAGDPILGQIRSKNLTNTLVIVVRYFGGIKLGASGLITAYKAAAESALAEARVIEREVKEVYLLTFGYVATPDVMRLVKEFDVEVVHQEFGESCVMETRIARRGEAGWVTKLQRLHDRGADVMFQRKQSSHP